MRRAWVIRRELEEVEDRCNRYYKICLKWKLIGQQSRWYELYLHFQGRRRFFLKDLLKVQLKEFDREG